jgi:hypothetical protein
MAPGVAPVVTQDVVRDYADQQQVCVRPLLRKVTDRATGTVHQLVLPCGSTRETVCGPCAGKARRLRAQQCAEGWHLTEDPLTVPAAGEELSGDRRKDEDQGDGADPDDQEEEGSDQAGEHDGDEDGEPEGGGGRRVRSTRRRSDAVELPRLPVEQRTVGRAFTGRDGVEYRPSMFVTLTLGSYGKIHPGTGTPVDPEGYDYRRAAVEALHFTKLFDRWVQNLRRCAGYRVQYFGAIEAQRRMAPHIHLALRGAIPRQVLRAVTQATYLQLWWPPHDEEDLVYPGHRLPVWDQHTGGYVDPDTGTVLPTWEQALDQLDADGAGLDGKAVGPAVVMRFGSQVDIKGIVAPSAEADRTIRYLTKYLTKDLAHTHTTDHDDHEQHDDDEHDGHDGFDGLDGLDGRDEKNGRRRRQQRGYRAHLARLWAQLRILPCSPDCANWLRYGIQPRNANAEQHTAVCEGRAHSRDHLGLGGRRVQVSRHWSGKTLAGHRADRAAVVRTVLAAAGIAPPEADRMATSVLAEDGKPRFVWEDLPVHDRDYTRVVMASVIEARRWRREYEAAKQHAAEQSASNDARAGPQPCGGANSATTPLRPPDPQPSQVA